MPATPAETAPDSQGLLAFLRLLFVRLDEDKAMIHASSLTYTTLLALVPLMTVSLVVLSAFPVGEAVSEGLQNFVFENFVPAAGEVVRGYLSEFSGKASRLTGTSFLFLVVTSLLLMASIDRAFNDIWRVQQQRKATTKFLVYWAVLSVGPLLMGLSLAATSYLLSIPLLSGPDAVVDTSRLFQVMPLLASALAFTLIYMLVPMRRVPVRHALAGGITAALLFELAKRGFGTYLAYFPTYQAIYGALATFPIFLVWIFLSWLVTLFGAELTYCLGIRHYSRRRGHPAGARLGDAVAFLEALWRAQLDGHGLSVDELAADGGIPAATADELAVSFSSVRWIAAAEDGTWLLSRDLHMLNLADLYNLGGFAMPGTEQLADLSRGGRNNLAELLARGRDELTATLDVPLTSMFRERPTADPQRDGGAAENVEEDA